MNLQEATMQALQGKLEEAKYLVDRRDWIIHNDHEANWFGGNACWKDVKELNLKSLSDEEKIKSLQSLKDNIDTDVTQRVDYKDIESKYVNIWLDGYKAVIDRLLDEIATKGKYCIFLNVDVSNRGDVDHRGGYITIENGNIIEDTNNIKYYDNKDEAIRDMNSISKSQYKEFVYSNYVSDYDEAIQWSVDVEQYEPNTWELR